MPTPAADGHHRDHAPDYDTHSTAISPACQRRPSGPKKLDGECQIPVLHPPRPGLATRFEHHFLAFDRECQFPPPTSFTAGPGVPATGVSAACAGHPLALAFVLFADTVYNGRDLQSASRPRLMTVGRLAGYDK